MKLAVSDHGNLMMKGEMSLPKLLGKIRERLHFSKSSVPNRLTFLDNNPKAQTIAHFRGAQFFAGRSNKIEAKLLGPGDYDRENLTFCEGLVGEGDVCFDVGANLGVYTVLFAKWAGSSGQVHAFEPVDNIRRKLRLNVTLNHLRNVRINAIALGDSNGYIEMNQVKEGQFRGGTSCVIENDNVLSMGRDKFTRVQVEMKTVDDYLLENNVTQVDFVKVDIEGYELNFLKGASRLLSEHRPVVLMEHNPNRLELLGISEIHFQEIFQKISYECLELLRTGEVAYFVPYRFDRQMRGTNLACLPM
jgi:FkbM family methyltransferase